MKQFVAIAGEPKLFMQGILVDRMLALLGARGKSTETLLTLGMGMLLATGMLGCEAKLMFVQRFRAEPQRAESLAGGQNLAFGGTPRDLGTPQGLAQAARASAGRGIQVPSLESAMAEHHAVQGRRLGWWNQGFGLKIPPLPRYCPCAIESKRYHDSMLMARS